MLKKTPLHDHHTKLNARFTEFGGWDMPVQYDSIMAEHEAVRTSAGIFDTSHMGVVIIGGQGSTAFLNKLTTAPVPSLVEGQAKYSLFLNEDGGIIDDLIIYRRRDDYLLIINAGNTDKDLAWMAAHRPDDVSIEKISDRVSLLALQGPASEKILQHLVQEPLASLRYFHFMTPTFKDLAPNFRMVARTGYTGEDGFEILVSNEQAPAVWEKLLSLGAKPAGLGSRDTLRLEACMPLHGHEISDTISPLEAGLGWAVSWDKDFIGKEALLRKKEAKPFTYLIAFILDSGIPRAHCAIFAGGKPSGEVTSGTFSPTLKKGIGLGYVNVPVREGETVQVQVHGQPKNAVVTRRPFYKRKK